MTDDQPVTTTGKRLPRALPEKPDGWRQMMVMHLNMGSKGHIGTYAIFDERDVELPIHLGYSTSKKDGYRGFFFYGSKECLTWAELRKRWPQYLKTRERLLAAGKRPDAELKDDKALSMYVIYDHPKDLRGGFVVRQWEVFANGRVAHGELLGQDLPDLEAARKALPQGVINIGRTEEDDPVIVEVWL